MTPFSLPPELACAIESELLGVWSFLAALEHMGKPAPTIAELSKRVGSRRRTYHALSALERLCLLSREWTGGGYAQAPTRVLRTHRPAPAVAERLARIGRCKRCRLPALNWRKGLPVSTGVHCAACKQKAGRWDREWHEDAVALMRKGLSPVAVSAKLSRAYGYRVPMWRHTPQGHDIEAEGIVELGLREGVLDPDEWKDALAGGTPEGW